jgi:hypothetical protein
MTRALTFCSHACTYLYLQACFAKILQVVEETTPYWKAAVQRAMGISVTNAVTVAGLNFAANGSVIIPIGQDELRKKQVEFLSYQDKLMAWCLFWN